MPIRPALTLRSRGLRGPCPELAPQSVRGDRRVLHRLHRLYAGDALSSAVLPAARRHRGWRDRALVGAEPGRDARAHGAALAILGPPGRSIRTEDHGRAIAHQLHLP